MSRNRQLAIAENYHALTKHSYASVRADRHFLDWANQPIPFKIYPALEPIPLPQDLPQTGVAALSALSQPVGEGASREIDLGVLASLLFFSAGITRRRKYPGGEIFFRAAACTGALYEMELYVVCGELAGLPPGVYHFGVGDFSLRRLRAGDYRGALLEATAGEPALARAPLTIVCTGTYWRNAWKYQARTYRHFGWDNGTLLANLLAMCAAWGLPARVCCGFVDDAVNRLLGLDAQREVVFSLVAVGAGAGAPPQPPASLAPLELETVPLSEHEVDYPLMREMHEGSCLDSPEEVTAWRAAKLSPSPSPPAGPTVPLPALEEAQLPRDTIEQVILRRGSCRRFSGEPIGFEQLSTVLRCATAAELPADFSRGARLNGLYLIGLGVEGLPSGTHVFHPGRGELECLREGNFRSEAAYLALEQELGGSGGADVYFLADLAEILPRLGNRGYRAAQLEAGILGGKLYLAAYAMGLGATGLTFYDDEVVEFFSPHARGKSAIFLVALGKSTQRKAR